VIDEPRGEACGQLLGGAGKIAVFIEVQGHRHGIDIADEGFVDGETGAGVDNLVARIAVNLLGETNRGLGATVEWLEWRDLVKKSKWMRIPVNVNTDSGRT